MMLTYIHYTYLLIILFIILAIILKKDVTLICILGVGLIGILSTRSLLEGIKIIYKSIVVSGKHFIDVVIIISIINCMAKSLSDIGADGVIISPIKRFMVSKNTAFIVIGITNIIMSWLFWPTPAVMLVGAIMVPAAIEVGLPKIWAAVALSLFGKGVAFSSDFFIQGTPSIMARSAGVKRTIDIIKASIPFWLVMSISVIVTSFLIMNLETKRHGIRGNKGNLYEKEIKNESNVEENKDSLHDNRSNKKAKIAAMITMIGFILDIIIMSITKVSGNEATALIGSTSIIILIVISFLGNGFNKAFENFTNYIRNGFMFGMKIFSPIIIIGALFFLGSDNTAKEILGNNATGILTDIGLYISTKIKLSKITAVTVEGLISALLGISGSGFGGIPLVGTLANTFAKATNVDLSKIAAFGQIITVWIGGGTVIPWSLLPVSTVCDVNAIELAKKNLIPVLVGVILTFIFAVIWI
ncbi:membrane protein [Clostridium novyi A str. 4552]|uniref:Membrane protein n=1 Tax=Clostridium novyi A str. 4552 TaxID=1444289 RepID=A0A0A0IEJ2_CLONO|nr:hypothetical protein [Clostridium novyi]KGM98025.1 membrane protein [Clostridium novyi A str. 4552]